MLVVAIGIVMITLRILSFKSRMEEPTNGSKHSTSIYMYVAGNWNAALSRFQSTTFRIAVGVWCLVCFVLTQAYNSTLITYVIAPNDEPEISSIYDIVKNPKIRLLLDKNLGLDVFLRSSNDDFEGIYRAIRERADTYTDSHCITQSQCVSLVTSGRGNYVYAKSRSYLMEAMLTDFQESGQCRLQLIKDSLMHLLISFALAKHSAYTKFFNSGIIEMDAFGLIQHWRDLNSANIPQCLNKNVRKRSSTNPRLSLKNLIGAFVVLYIGWTLSLLVFVMEYLNFFYQRCSRNRRIIE